jgi:hypothetical protein
MNERILELARQAAAVEGWGPEVWQTTFTEKFAELIIKSVMADLEKLRAEYDNPGMYESVEYYDSMRAKESALEEALDTIQYNFGVDK